MRIVARRSVEISKEAIGQICGYLLGAAFDSRDKAHDFEKEFANYLGVKYAISIPSARLGLSILLDSFDIAPQDEIILSAYNYHVIAALIKLKGIKPVFIDIEGSSWNMDTSLIESKITPRTKAVLATHLFGRPCELENILTICGKHNLILIEDAAHACGAKYKGRYVGNFGDAAYFSFGVGKSLVALGGGMLVTNNNLVFDRIRKIMSTKYNLNDGFDTVSFIKNSAEIFFSQRIPFQLFVYPAIYLMTIFNLDFIDRLIEDGYCLEDGMINSRAKHFSNLQAILAKTQINRLDFLNKRRSFLANVLTGLLKDIEQVKTPGVYVNEGGLDISLYYSIYAKQAKELRRYLLFRGIDTKRGTMRGCSALPFLNCADKCCRAEMFADNIIELPCYPGLEISDIYYEANCIRSFYGLNRLTVSSHLCYEEKSR